MQIDIGMSNSGCSVLSERGTEPCGLAPLLPLPLILIDGYKPFPVLAVVYLPAFLRSAVNKKKNDLLG